MIEPNPNMLVAADMIRARFPNDVVSTFHECDLNVDGEYGAHAWNDAVDHWGKGIFKKRHMDKTFEVAMRLGPTFNLDRIYYRGFVYGPETEWQAVPLPPGAPQHFDHIHLQFLPRRSGPGLVPPGCPPL